MTSPAHRDSSTDGDEEEAELPLPSFSEQMAEQLGGLRGLLESSIPVAAFVIVNIFAELHAAIISSVILALGIAAYRLSRKEPVRHALNGLFGIAIGAFIANKTGNPRDFHLPSILFSLAYAVGLTISVLVRWPVIGWVWSVTFAKGIQQWRTEPRLLHLFGRLTMLWAAVYVVKVSVLSTLYLLNQADALGIARLVLGYPPYALLLAVTVYSVRRVMRTVPAPE
jgi:Protein of unknown function (DUF3159)